jgi:hypothetical protein
MYKLEFTLKQHTPLIHFQHDQEGATLRATEVKPKLDQFIIEKLLKDQSIQVNYFETQGDGHQKFINSREIFKRKANAPENEIQKKWTKWLLGKGMNEHVALDYKMVILAGENHHNYVFSSLPNSKKDVDRIINIKKNLSAKYINNTQYFADNEFIDKQDQHNSVRQGIMYDTINIRIICLHVELMQIIEKIYKSFFVITAFGTRQTKGFGCFLPIKINDNEIIELIKSVSSVTGIFLKASKDDFYIKLQDLSKTYSLLKRGQSFPGYQKSKLWEYMCDKHQIKWEKRKIKIHVKDNDPDLFAQLKIDADTLAHRVDDRPKDAEDQKYRYIRALMGLAEQYEFALNLPGNKKLKVAVKDKLKSNYDTKEFAVDRFKSPIQFIVTDSSIFLITHEISGLLHHWIDEFGIAKIRNYRFTIDLMKTNKSFDLEVPANFDLAYFIERKANYGMNLKKQ